MALYGTFKPQVPNFPRSSSTPIMDDSVAHHWWHGVHPGLYSSLTLFGQAHKPKGRAHHFTTSDQEKLQAFESMGYHPAINAFYRHYLMAGRQSLDLRKWLLMGLFGILMAFLCALVKQSLQAIMAMKDHMVETYMHQPVNGFTQLLFGMVCLNVGLALVASLLVALIAPQAAGSGMPEVLAALNGVDLPNVFKPHVLAVKVVSLIFAICSGLPIGLQGPVIHIGAQVGHLLSTSKWFWDSHDARRRADFISAGVANAIAAAFGAPIGGLLFVMEAAASWWDMKTMSVMILFSCLTCFFMSQLTETAFVGFQPTDNMGYLGNRHVGDGQPFHLRVNGMVFLPAMLLGIVCGLLSSLFIIGNIGFAHIRARCVGAAKVRKVLEVCVLCTIFTFLSVGLPHAISCAPIHCQQSPQAAWVTSLCPEPNSYNPLGSLSLHSGREVLDRLLWSKVHHVHCDRPFPLHILAMYLALYFTFAMMTAGSAISSGMVVPSLVMGALAGRLFALICNEVLFHTGVEGVSLDPGVFAYLGAGAFFAGIFRMTFSLVAIMVEISGDVNQLFALMVAIYVSNLVANQFTHSLNQSLLEFRCVPMLDDAQGFSDCLAIFSVSHIMTQPVVTVSRLNSPNHLSALLANTTHNAFPVVEPATNALLGVVTREQLQNLLDPTEAPHQQCPLSNVQSASPLITAASSETEGLLNYKAHQKLVEVSSLGFGAASCFEVPSGCIDLAKWMDTSPFTVQHDFSLRPTLQLFRQLGLRHLIVLDGRKVVGIVTRKDLLPQVIEGFLTTIRSTTS